MLYKATYLLKQPKEPKEYIGMNMKMSLKESKSTSVILSI